MCWPLFGNCPLLNKVIRNSINLMSCCFNSLEKMLNRAQNIKFYLLGNIIKNKILNTQSFNFKICLTFDVCVSIQTRDISIIVFYEYYLDLSMQPGYRSETTTLSRIQAHFNLQLTEFQFQFQSPASNLLHCIPIFYNCTPKKLWNKVRWW